MPCRLITRCAALVLAALALAGPVGAGEPPRQPFLRIEPAAHVAPVARLATDADARLLATVSRDKTLRLWSLADGTPRGRYDFLFASDGSGFERLPDGRLQDSTGAPLADAGFLAALDRVAAEPGAPPPIDSPVPFSGGWALYLGYELAAEIEQKAVEEHIAKLTAEAEVTRPGEGIDPAVLKDASILDK